jgi:hypothetical protein
LGTLECLFFGLSGKARQRGMVIPFKAEQHSQAAQKTGTPACSDFTPVVSALNGKNANRLMSLSRLTSGQLRFLG